MQYIRYNTNNLIVIYIFTCKPILVKMQGHLCLFETRW